METALRAGRVPGELADAVVMRFMGWGWRDLCEAPAQLVEDIQLWMEKQAAIGEEQARLREAMANRGR